MTETRHIVQGSLIDAGRDRSVSLSSSSSDGEDGTEREAAPLAPPLALVDRDVQDRLRRMAQQQNDDDDGELEICLPASSSPDTNSSAVDKTVPASTAAAADNAPSSSSFSVPVQAPDAAPLSAMDAYLLTVASLEAKARSKAQGEESALALAMEHSVERVLSGTADAPVALSPIPTEPVSIEVVATGADVPDTAVVVPPEAISENDGAEGFGEEATEAVANKSNEEAPRPKPTSADSFGIVYKPFKKPQSEYKTPGVAFEDEFEFESELKKASQPGGSIATVATVATSNGDDDDFDFDVAPDAQTALKGKSIKETIEATLAREVEVEVEVEDAPSASSESSAVDKESNSGAVDVNNTTASTESAEAAPASTFDSSRILSDAREALKSYTEVYEQGLGDQEVEIIKSFGTLDADQIGAAATAKSGDVSTSAKANIIAETIEEGDEEEHEQAELAEQESAMRAESEKARLESEWDHLDAQDGGAAVGDIQIETQPEDVSVSYDLLLASLRSVDVSKFESSLVLQSRGWSLLGPPKLNFSGNIAEEKFVFSCAMIDYEPSAQAIHLAALRRIFTILTGEVGSAVPMLGAHWDRIGFQGLDPRTDINRSMKMFAVLQVLHLVENFQSFARDLHQLSNVFIRNADGEILKDLTWPFFCVSIGFTKHAVQTFRSGALNKECNKKQDILSALHEYHRACFSVFARDLRKNSDVHHAVHLSNLNKIVQSDPISVLSQYRAQANSATSTAAQAEEVVHISDLGALSGSPSKNGGGGVDTSSKSGFGSLLSVTRTKNYESAK